MRPIIKDNHYKIIKLLKEHNDSVIGFKTNIQTLKKVYARGAAYGLKKNLIAPDIERLALNRVKNFLFLMKNGKPINVSYDHDNDLLPKFHPVKCVWSDYLFEDRAKAEELSKILGFSGIHSTMIQNKKYYIPGSNHQDIINLVKGEEFYA